MKKIKLVFVGVFFLFLSGCQFTNDIQNALTQAPTSVSEITTPSSTVAATNSTATMVPSSETTAEPTIAFTASAPAECVVTPVLPVLTPEMDALLPGVSPEDWVYGPEKAGVTFYEYGDFQSPFGAKLAPILKALQKKFPDAVRVIYRHYPVSSIDDKAILAAQAAEAAGLQNKFWQMHDALFSEQSSWTSLSHDDFTTWLIKKAKTINLNATKFTTDLTSQAIIDKVAQAEADGKRMVLSATPFLFVNKFPYQGRNDLETLSSVVRYFLLPDSAFQKCPDLTVNPDKKYTATVKTEKGEIVIELYPKQAPWAVNSFIFLAKRGWLNNSTFFRVIPGFVVQGGDPTGSGLGSPGYSFSNEITPDLRFDKPGVVAMSNSGTSNNGSQFFITYTAVPEFDGKYTIVGQVISGMDVLTSLRPRDPINDALLLPADNLVSITITEE
jgi:cyclophilin family peptidyl-prolyl cis-trans isomerase/protein-disulfide isomerase